jgi:RNA polymerase sporulation-specific sigma factor
MQFEDYTDEELIARYRECRDPDIVDYLLVKYKPLVISKTRMLFLTGGEHDDLLQEGMLGLFKAVRDYRPEASASFATFAGICVERNIYQAIEKAQRLKNKPLNEAVSMSEMEDQASGKDMHRDPAEIMIGEENAGVLRKEISRCLSKLENRVLDLFLEGKDYREIAQLLDRSPKSIDNALQRIRGKVRHLVSGNPDM